MCETKRVASSWDGKTTPAEFKVVETSIAHNVGSVHLVSANFVISSTVSQIVGVKFTSMVALVSEAKDSYCLISWWEKTFLCTYVR